MVISFSWGGQNIFAVLIGIPPLVAAALMSRRSLFFIFYFMCVLFVVGQRTLYWGPSLRFVPGEMLLYLLGFLCLGYKTPSPLLRQGGIPAAVWVLFLATFFAVYSTARWTYYQPGDLNQAFFYAKMMWLSIPAFFVCGRLIQRFEHVQTTILLISVGCFFLSGLALAEYYHLPFIRYFGGFVEAKSHDSFSAEGFRRLGASFWGGPMLAGYLTVSFPVIMSQFFNSKSNVQKMITLGTLVMNFLVIYYSGHRGLWVTCLISIAIFFYLKGLKGIFILLLLGSLGLHFVPDIAKERIQSVVGSTEDSSAKKRKERAEYAWEMVKRDPIIGSGWGSSGLVHSDFLQLWADAGGVAFLSLLFIFLQITSRLWIWFRKIRDRSYREYYFGLFASVSAGFIILWHQAWFNLPEQFFPFWILMALAYHYPTICLNDTRVALTTLMNKVEMEKKQNA